jgi:aspartyl-tRNA(Asn)/glutamyl-tRNA(Gln) amidotransferase subunit A
LELHEQSIAELSKRLGAGEVSSTELTTHMLERIRAHDAALNCFITVTEEAALAQAKSADERIAAGQAGPLTGVPIAHKDIFCTQDVRTSCGSRMLENFVSPYDATVVSKLQQAGAVMLGKTNMDEFAIHGTPGPSQVAHPAARRRPLRRDCAWRRPAPIPVGPSANPPH